MSSTKVEQSNWNLRVPAELLDALKAEAKQEYRSASSMPRVILIERYKNDGE